MDNRLYRSKLGDVKSYEGWQQWANEFYKGLLEPGYNVLPDNWFKRVSKVLGLEEVQ